jgi:hypothetical protein
MKIVSVGPELLLVDRQTDRRTEGWRDGYVEQHGTFREYANMPKRGQSDIVPFNRRLFVSVNKNTLSPVSLSLLFLIHFEETISLST